MMHKIISELVVYEWRLKYLKNKKNEELIESTCGVPTKDPPKVKPVIEESPIT